MHPFRCVLLLLLPLMLLDIVEAQSASIRLTVPSASMTGDCFYEGEYNNSTKYIYDCMSEASAKVWFELNGSFNGSLHMQEYSASMVGENLPTALSYLRFNVTNMTFHYFYFRIYYTDAEIANNGLDESALAAFRWDGSSWVSVDEVQGVFAFGVNATGNYVWVNTSVLSDWGLGEKSAATPYPGGGPAQYYPVPLEMPAPAPAPTAPPPSAPPSFRIASIDAVSKNPLVIEIDFEGMRVGEVLSVRYSTAKLFSAQSVGGSKAVVPSGGNISYFYDARFRDIGIYHTVVEALHAGVFDEETDYAVILPNFNLSRRTTKFVAVSKTESNASNATVRIFLLGNESAVLGVENGSIELLEGGDFFAEYRGAVLVNSEEFAERWREASFRERAANSARIFIYYHRRSTSE